ncbi:unnamed protein product [Sympodiomycopsis kandeliae]
MSSAMTAQRPSRGLAGGWLSMAPEPERDQQQQSTTTASSSSPPSSRKAVFSIGQEEEASTEDDDDIDTPITPQSQDDNGSSSFMSPAFDVRASFAPMVFKRTQPLPPPVAESQPQISVSDYEPERKQMQGQVLASEYPIVGSSKAININAAASRMAYLQHIEDDGQGIQYAGRRWKGKTAHAVEQEMEIAGDTTVMSYAPDAVYLASRLEGLRRNLEVGGDDARGRRWIDVDDDIYSSSDSASLHTSGSLSPAAKAKESRTPDDRRPATLPPHITDLIPSVSLNNDKTLLQPTLQPLDPAAKAAALESRIEIRLLRRSDLEQVRELHCLHGDHDKIDAEHYVTSAAFLLRLLVDESHVCLVAVAKPLPEPVEPFPSRDVLPAGHHHGHHHGKGVPRCPPPSMDMPPSSAPYVFASKGLATSSPFLGASPDTHGAKRRKQGNATTRISAPAPSISSLGRQPSQLGSMQEEEEEEEEEITSDSESDVDSTKAADDDEEDRDADLSPTSSLSIRLDDVDMHDGDGDAGRAIGADRDVSTSWGTSDSTSLNPSTIPPLSPFEAARHKGAPRGIGKQHTRPGLLEDSSASTSPLSLSSSGMAPKRDYATTDMVLAGPTNEVAPPRALRVMIPPAPGAAVETETILGVASAQVTVKPPTESLWGDADAQSSQPHKEIHLLTLSVAQAERGLGLGGKLLDQVIEEASNRNVGAAYRAAMGRRSSSTDNGLGSTRTYLQVHAQSSHAIRLYNSRGFETKDRLQGYFRGDTRIPSAIRSMPGGNDAFLMQRFEGSDR